MPEHEGHRLGIKESIYPVREGGDVAPVFARLFAGMAIHNLNKTLTQNLAQVMLPKK